MDERRARRALEYLSNRATAPKIVQVARRPPEDRPVADLAERLLKIFAEHDWDAYNDPALLGLLAEADLPERLPEKLQSLILEVLYFAYRLDQEESGPNGPEPPSR